MSVESVRRKVTELAVTEGRVALHAKNPNDFEYYALSLELVDSQFNTLKIMHFPVMPTAISINRQSPLNIKKTGHAYFTQYTDAFQAYGMSIQGTFGRKFRLLINKDEDDKKLKDYDLNVKTGYGVTKLLEDMILQSQETAESNVKGSTNHKFLILYNLTFNQQFIIEVMNFQFTQSMENNTMWNYNLDIRALGDVRQLIGFDSDKALKNILTNAKLNKQANTVFNNLTAGGVFKTKAQLVNDLISF